MEELRDKFKELKERGVEVVHDDESDKLFAININNVKYKAGDYCGDEEGNKIFDGDHFPIVRDLTNEGIWVNSRHCLNISDK